MERIRLWEVSEDKGGPVARALPDVPRTDTERVFEDLVVRSPDLLMEKIRLVGRQLPTTGGILDLLGIDADGRVVVFELKRGMLTRDAVAQVVDYASHLSELDDRALAVMVEDNSGRDGIDEIEDFLDWYSQEHPDRDGLLLERPKMVLVGLGVDERTRRMVAFLARAGVEIDLLTFQAFEAHGTVLFARQAESPRPPHRNVDRLTGKEKLRLLMESARELEVDTLLDEVVSWLRAQMPGCERKPGKTGYGFYLWEKTSVDGPRQRSYATLNLGKAPGLLRLSLPRRATEPAADAVQSICTAVPDTTLGSGEYDSLKIEFDAEVWKQLAAPLAQLFAAVMENGNCSREES